MAITAQTLHQQTNMDPDFDSTDTQSAQTGGMAVTVQTHGQQKQGSWF